MNRSTESRLQKLEAENETKSGPIIWVNDQMDADRKLADYEGKGEPVLVRWQW